MKETEITEQRNIPNVFYVTFNSDVSNLGIFLRGGMKKMKKWPWGVRRTGQGNGRVVTIINVNDKHARGYASPYLGQ